MDILAKTLIFLGFGIIVVGLVIWLGSRIGLPFGQLPGDVHVNNDGFSLYIPIVTSLVLSVILTVLINLILWVWRK